MTEMLLRAGASTAVQNPDSGATPLDIATMMDDTPLIDLLTRYAAPVA